MRKTLLALVFSVCAGAASASSISNNSGVADTAVTAVNTTVNGDAVGLWGNAVNVNSSSGYIGTGAVLDGFHFGLKVNAGPGTNFQSFGALYDVWGGSGVNDVWGTKTNANGPGNVMGSENVVTASNAWGYNATAYGDNYASGYSVVESRANNGNAYGADLGTINAYNGSGYGVNVGNAYGDYNAYGFNADGVYSAGGNAYGLRVPSVTGYYTGYGVSAQATGTYGGAYGAWLNASTQYYNGYGVYATAYSENQDGIGIYAYGSSTYGNGVAAFLDGDVYASGGSCTYCSPSDQMFKKNVKPMAGGLKTIMALKPKTYEMKVDDYKDKISLAKGPQRGFIAQEMKEVVPELVHEITWPARLSEEERKNGVKKEGMKFNAVNYTELIPVLVQAMQEQQALIKALETKVAQLEAR